jgi:ABC-type transport system substrate-binding protein
MKLRLCLFLAAISAVLLASPARTAKHPRYGGTLRLEIGASVNSLDAEVTTPSEIAFAKEQLQALIHSRPTAGNWSADSASGPFRIVEWEPGRQARLAANDDYAGGRPFVDFIEIQMGRSAKQRLLDLELGKTDLAEIPPEDARIAADRGVRLSTSQPEELVALYFVSGRPLPENIRVRQALAEVIDRSSIANFILQKQGEAAGGLLPQWSSGTAFLFSTALDATAAKEQWAQIPGSPKISVGYDAGDALEQAIAERVAVNAHEAGIPVATISVAASSAASAKVDARLLPLRMASSGPQEALAGFLATLAPLTGIDPSSLSGSASPEQIYACERSIVNSYRVIPVVWLPSVYGLSGRMRDWKVPAPGQSWPLADVWLDDSPNTAGSK